MLYLHQKWLLQTLSKLLLLLPDIRQEQLSPRLEQIRLQLQAASVPGYSRIRMSASIGGVWIDDENVKMRCSTRNG